MLKRILKNSTKFNGIGQIRTTTTGEGPTPRNKSIMRPRPE
jgi:hypothetical protein